MFRGLAKDPADRFESCRQFIAALAGNLSDGNTDTDSEIEIKSPLPVPDSSETKAGSSRASVKRRATRLIGFGLFLFAALLFVLMRYPDFGQEISKFIPYSSFFNRDQTDQKKEPPLESGPGEVPSVLPKRSKPPETYKPSAAINPPATQEPPKTAYPPAVSHTPATPQPSSILPQPSSLPEPAGPALSLVSPGPAVKLPRHKTAFRTIRYSIKINEYGVVTFDYTSINSLEPPLTFESSPFIFEAVEGGVGFRGNNNKIGRVVFPLGNISAVTSPYLYVNDSEIE